MDKLISLCMIVKDEERVLRRCLESVKGLVDEIVIVDTGSTDATKSIASEYTEHIYDFEWIDNFSAAKNRAIEQASGKWILVLDADEYVQNEKHQELRDYISGLDASKPLGILLPIMNLVGQSDKSASRMIESSAARLFPNHPDVYYTRPIHEQLTYRKGQIPLETCSFLIFHTGYTDETRLIKDKSKRNLRIFEGMNQSDTHLDPYTCFTLANEYDGIKDYKKAIYYYERAYKRSKPKDLWLVHCLDRMIQTLINLDRMKDAYDLIEMSLNRWPHFSDYHCLKGFMLDHFGLYEQARISFQESISIAENAEKQNRAYWLVNLDYGNALPYEKLSEIYYRAHNQPQTVYCLTKTLKSNPQNLVILYKLINLLCQSEQPDSIIAFMEQLYPKQESMNSLLMLRIFLLAGQNELVKYYFERCKLLDINLAITDVMRYALVTGNEAYFKEAIQKIDLSIGEDSDLHKMLLLASVLWKNAAYLSVVPISQEHPFLRLKLILQSALTNQINPHVTEFQDHELLYTLITELFTMHYFETFDWMMNQFSHPILTNLIADYFYSRNQLDLAMDYYSILLQDQSLHASGYENLGTLYLNQGMLEEGLSFLQKAIELNPEKCSLYPLFCSHCTDVSIKVDYKTKFLDRFPQYKNITFIKQL